MVKLEWIYTIFYNTENNLLTSMGQHQVKLKFEVAYLKVSVRAPPILNTYILYNNKITDSTVSYAVLMIHESL